MSFIKIMVHVVWSTKNRKPLIRDELKVTLLDHIKINSKQKGIFIDTLNCVADHIHLLISLGPEQTISKIVQLLKGESSHWVNERQILTNRFEWQDDYYAASVSESGIDSLRKYIRQQEKHHRRRSFAEEYDEFVGEHEHIQSYN